VGILLIIACKKDKGVINPKEWKAYPINEIKTYSDSSYYFGRIINSTEYNDIIVLNDNKFNRAILYDTSLQFKRIIGGEGKGPKEFGKLSGNPIIDKNYIYLYDLTTNKIKIFKKNGKYYESINYPLPAGEDFIHFDYCKDTNNNFYSSSYLKDKPIIKFSQKGNILNEFGEFIPSINMKHKRVLNYRHTIVTQDNKIITVNIRNPRIKIFSDNGELIAQYNYNNFFDYYIESVNKRIKKSKKNNSPYIIEIDHHPKVDDYSDLEIRQNMAASTTEIIYDIAQFLNITFNKSLSECLLTGIVTDTGNFFYPNASAKTLKISAHLLEKGANLSKIIKHVNSNKNLATLSYGD